MTALAKRISETPMAPYADLLRSMKPREMHIVVSFLQEAMVEAGEKRHDSSAAGIIREKFKSLRPSIRTQWYKDFRPNAEPWDAQEAWEQLTDEQREQAERLNLAPEDMDARTFAILTKWIS